MELISQAIWNKEAKKLLDNHGREAMYIGAFADRWATGTEELLTQGAHFDQAFDISRTQSSSLFAASDERIRLALEFLRKTWRLADQIPSDFTWPPKPSDRT